MIVRPVGIPLQSKRLASDGVTRTLSLSLFAAVVLLQACSSSGIETNRSDIESTGSTHPSSSTASLKSDPIPSSSEWVLTSTGFGPIKIGMSKSEVEAAIGTELRGWSGPTCGHLLIGDWSSPDVDLRTEGSAMIVRKIDVMKPVHEASTDKAIRFGSDTARIPTAYGASHVKEITDSYGGMTDTIPRFEVRYSDGTMLYFSSSQGRVVGMTAGTQAMIDRDETATHRICD